MRYFMRLAYNGASYHGWQVQPSGITVQEVVEKALGTLLRHTVKVVGAGRTDAGVNARMMVAHFDTPVPLKADASALLRSANALVGRDIAIYSIFPAINDDAHARFSATSRTYKYFAHEGKSPFLNQFSWRCYPGLDFDLMNQAACHLLTVSDFTSFSKLHTDVKTNLCRVTHAQWQREGEQWAFTITADRFLRNMVRAIVGTLVDVGTHRTSVLQFDDIIAARNRCKAGNSMPAQALFLWDITYPFEIF